MRRNSRPLLTGTFRHRRTESDYLGVLLEAVSLEDWRAVVNATLEAAKVGDPGARAWLAQYLVGKPAAQAPAPLTVLVQQLSGRDPLVEQLAEPHVDRMKYPALHADDQRIDALRAQVANELLAHVDAQAHASPTTTSSSETTSSGTRRRQGEQG
ncbi:MAG: hypothetical protein FJW27_19465 [Acidimicrobiia bacterium]|nr:hypothetical protein [Acidimicrobiia bacterium]